MNIAIIFAGGTGIRMKTSGLPKQFLNVYGKPIIIYTLEKFEKNIYIDGIIVICLQEYINILNEMIEKFSLKKIISVIPGGKTGQESIYNGLIEANNLFSPETIVLIHDGVRPIINDALINKNIEIAKKFGCAISAAKAIETIVRKNIKSNSYEIIERDNCLIAKAPQTFFLGKILSIHEKAKQEKYYKAIDCASLMSYYGEKLYFVDCENCNIKITHPIDYYIFKSLLDAFEGQQIFGI